MVTPGDERQWHWDGQQWHWWNGHSWQAGDPDSDDLPPVPPDATAAPAPATVVAQPPTARRGIPPLAWVALGVVGALILAAAGIGVFALARRGQEPTLAADTSVVTTEPISTSVDPFTPSGATGTDTAVAPVTTPSPVAVPGGKVGLYGGTLNAVQCDKTKLVTFLAANPDKARAWAGVQGIQASQIQSFVAGLTSVILRSDTLVTNHGFVNGQATTFLSILQAGTAVMVNNRGLPVVKCYCGNPLTPPPANPGRVVYRGPTWPGWSTTSITVIQVNTTIINTFTLTNIVTNQTFTRPAGTDGRSDSPATPATPAPSTPLPTYTPEPLPSTEEPTPVTPSDQPTAEPTSAGSEGDAVAILQNHLTACNTATASTLLGGTFAAHPVDGGGGQFYHVIVTSPADGYSYKWTVNLASGGTTAADEAAAGVDSECAVG